MDNALRQATDSRSPSTGGRAGLRISLASVFWTTCSSAVAVGLGLSSGTAVLVAFGAVGLVDAVGSVALVSHFRHALRHDSYSQRGERVAHLVVLGSLLVVGGSAVVGGIVRASGGHGSHTTTPALVFTAVSLIVCVWLATAKRRIASVTGSAALASDAHVSAIAAVQAVIVLAGAGATELLGWTTADGIATAIVGGGALLLAITTWRTELRGSQPIITRESLPTLAFAVVTIVAGLDLALGSRLVLVGALVIGPVLVAGSMNRTATLVVSSWSVLLAVLLSAPDDIWMTSTHAAWLTSVTVVAVGTSAVVWVTGPRWDRTRPG